MKNKRNAKKMEKTLKYEFRRYEVVLMKLLKVWKMRLDIIIVKYLLPC